MARPEDPATDSVLMDSPFQDKALLQMELARANDDVYAAEKSTALQHLTTRLSSVASLDLIALQASNASIYQAEINENLARFAKQAKSFRPVLKQQVMNKLDLCDDGDANKTPLLDAANGAATTVPKKRGGKRTKKDEAGVGQQPAQSRKRRASSDHLDESIVLDEFVSNNKSSGADNLESVQQPLVKKTRRRRAAATKVEAMPTGENGASKTAKNGAAKLEEFSDAELDDGETKVKRKRAKRKIASKQNNEQNSDQPTPKIKLKLKAPTTSSPSNGTDDESNTKPAVTAPAAPKLSQKEIRAIKRQYDNVYLNIWKDMARKDGPRTHRMMVQSQQAKIINLRKTALLAARESSKWKVRTNKNLKDLQTKARRSMREMFNFWKKNEREERDMRKKAEKEAIDLAKKQEEEREAQRQSRKLNFLLTQTELYSHFIGKKIKTDEIEGADRDSNLQDHFKTGSKHADVEEPVNATKNDIANIDFENEDDETLKRKAAENAQSALMAAKSKADEFNNQDDENEMNFQNPTSLGDIQIDQPKLLTCTLKEYQLKGLNWLANLYDKGINGILADEMGLGKTVQSISTLAYLAETHNIWGPFLVVTPASTLHNWQQELTKFVPDFKVLPYWGNAKDRKVLRKFWDRKNVIYNRDSPFHVLVTSYQLIVADAQYFQKIKWQYMILDEAQAIKSSQSSRWKILLGLQCRNRLLLTGTPIQNSMQELWALLHFIMPTLFDSHDEFSEWFSKDIENHATNNSKLNEAQLRRLHMILKPFMLRRIKKNVQKELGDKVEIDVFCDLTNRQQRLYQILKSQISLIDILESTKKGGNNSGDDSLSNLVMQFRKVCNHPDLFERADTKSSFNFGSFADTVSFSKESNESILDVRYSNRNVISATLPTLIYNELIRPNEENSVGMRNKVVNHLLNIWNEDYLHHDMGNVTSMIDLPNSKELRKGTLEKAISLHSYNDSCKTESGKLHVVKGHDNDSILSKLMNVKDQYYEENYFQVMDSAAEPKATAPSIEISCSSSSFVIEKKHTLFNPMIKKSLLPMSLNEEYELFEKRVPISEYPQTNMMPQPMNNKIGYSTIRIPSMNRFITDSGKLSKLDEMLVDLQKNDHRVLIYFQMTKMMDLMEEYLTFRQYQFIRLDGSSKLDDRRDLVHDWQTKPELFIFLLSTRAGGLGINLTAADTVIFYDSDWNPTIDSQAMDRAHRLGQTKQVTVYRMVVRGTIEERMRDRAKQKEHVQQVVMEGKGAEVQKDELKVNDDEKKDDVKFLLF
ncbi:chromatin-remodeling ATPase [Saccharomycopsis crataegensis]|uniref:Chromatin-remodeling ATPase INO80 n=1 Tax=Saccharomycopsis crataegensis TaxID=43959 RepID=A0AAV5QIG5_9ASCO|nr:chromatin-remodeling ATPase [Saccharomycopsis crataegensis]